MIMTCDQPKPALVAYLLNAIEPAERETLEAHLPG